MQLSAGETIVMSIQGQGATIRQDLQKTIREIQADVQREIQRDARVRAAEATAQTPPVPPVPPEPVIVTGEGRHVFVGGSEVPPWRQGEDIPPQAVEMAMGFFFTVVAIVIGLPIARAFARRMDRKAVAPQIPAELTAQLGQLTQAVDAIALEVERISEGQRFATRLLSEQRDSARQTLSAGADR
jgi:hypothetical protein